MERCKTNGVTSSDESNITISDSMFNQGSCGFVVRDGAHIYHRTIWNKTNNSAVRTIFDAPTSQLVMGHNTIHLSGGYSLDYGSTFPLANNLRDNSFVYTGSNEAIYVRDARLKLSHSNLWSPSTSRAPFIGDLVIKEGETEFFSRYNPLYADPDQLDFEPTEFSPLIGRASDGGDIGAVSHDGALTGQRLFGWVHEDLVLSPNDGPVDIIGDLIIPEGVTLTIEPGTILRFARTDLMVSGEDPTRVELIVFGRMIAQGLPEQRIAMISAQNTPNPNDWYGVRVESSDEGNVFQNIDISHARRSVSWMSDAQMILSRIDSRAPGEWHIEVRGAGPFLINQNRLQRGTAGILVRDSVPVNGVSVPAPTVSTISRNIISDVVGHSIRVDTNHREAQSLIDHNTVHATSENTVYVVQRQLDRGVEVSNNIFSDQRNVVVGGGDSNIQPNAHHNCYYYSRSTAFSSSRDTDNFLGNPLFVSIAQDDFRLSPESACIGRDENGEDTGALPSNGSEPSAGNMGYIRSDRVLGPGEVVIRGDLIVSAGSTLTILPGTELLMVVGDEMKRGRNESRVEIVIENQGVLKVGGGLEPARLLSTPPSNSPTGWHGIVVEPGGIIEKFENAELKNTYVGLQLQ